MPPIAVRSFQEEVFGLVMAVPPYTVPQESSKKLKAARAEVPTAGLPDDEQDDTPLVKQAQKAYGKRLRPLTEALARRLAGHTVPGISGQNWMDHVSSKKATREKMLELHTIHGVFDAPNQEKTAIVSILEGKKRFTFGLYLWQGHYGSGNGHDPILVYV